MREHMNEEPAVRLRASCGRAPAVRSSWTCARTSRPKRRGRRLVPGRSAFISAVTTRRFSRRTFGRGLFDVAPLRGGVRHGRDARRREALRHEQTERAPAAAELQNLLSVTEIGVLDGRFEGEGLSFERASRRRSDRGSRKYLPRGPEREREEVRGQLIVLLDWRRRTCWATGKRSISRAKSISLGPDRVERERLARSTSAATPNFERVSGSGACSTNRVAAAIRLMKRLLNQGSRPWPSAGRARMRSRAPGRGGTRRPATEAYGLPTAGSPTHGQAART